MPPSTRAEAPIKPSQVRVGVHVRIPLPWMHHSFMTSSFLVTTEAQVQEIHALGIDLYCDPGKCRVPPAPLVLDPLPDPARDAELSLRRAAQEARVALKREREAAMDAMRSRLDTVQRSFALAADKTAEAVQQLGARPREGVRALMEVAEESTRSLLADPDSTILMVSDKSMHHGDVAHAISVMTLALLLAKRLGEPESALRIIGVGALLHDVGIGSLSHSLVRNPARNRFEEASYQTHCQLGHKQLCAIGSLVPAPVLEIVLQHHEREDGKGYPGRRSGAEVPRLVKIVALADRFDEMTNPTDPTLALSPFEALAAMWARQRAAFDEVLLQHFIRAMGIYPPGTLVRLSDGRIGVVVAAAPENRRLCPQVLLYDPGTPRREAIILDLARSEPAPDSLPGIEKALRMQDLVEDELDYLLPRRKMSWFRAKT